MSDNNEKNKLAEELLGKSIAFYKSRLPYLRIKAEHDRLQAEIVESAFRELRAKLGIAGLSQPPSAPQQSDSDSNQNTKDNGKDSNSDKPGK